MLDLVVSLIDAQTNQLTGLGLARGELGIKQPTTSGCWWRNYPQAIGRADGGAESSRVQVGQARIEYIHDVVSVGLRVQWPAS